MRAGDPDASSLFPRGGIAGEALRACDWSKSPIGLPATWPLSLRAQVRAMLSTRQATCIFWGAEYVNLYNDGFVPLLGEKHPRAMGQSAREVWNDAWPVVGDLLAGVLARGEAVLFAGDARPDRQGRPARRRLVELQLLAVVRRRRDPPRRYNNESMVWFHSSARSRK
jgi:hypothetical protein